MGTIPELESNKPAEETSAEIVKLDVATKAYLASDRVKAGKLILREELMERVGKVASLVNAQHKLSPDKPRDEHNVGDCHLGWMKISEEAVREFTRRVGDEQMQTLASFIEFPALLDGQTIAGKIVSLASMKQAEVWDLLASDLNQYSDKPLTGGYLHQVGKIGGHDGARKWATNNGIGTAVSAVLPLITALVGDKLDSATFDLALAEMVGKTTEDCRLISQRVRQVKKTAPKTTTAPKELPAVLALPGSAIAETEDTPSPDPAINAKNAADDATTNLKWLELNTSVVLRAFDYFSQNLTQWSIVRSKCGLEELVNKDQRRIEAMSSMIGDFKTQTNEYAMRKPTAEVVAEVPEGEVPVAGPAVDAAMFQGAIPAVVHEMPEVVHEMPAGVPAAM